MRIRSAVVFLGSLLFVHVCFAQADPELGQGWMPEFNLAARHLKVLAEATPAAKFSWRPAPGVRSISEVYMHIALADLFFLSKVGVAIDSSKLPKDPEKAIQDKAEVIAWLDKAFAAVQDNYPKIDHAKVVRFLNKDVTSDGVLLRLLVHTEEHMGQSVAYARMVGVVPPWSQ